MQAKSGKTHPATVKNVLLVAGTHVATCLACMSIELIYCGDKESLQPESITGTYNTCHQGLVYVFCISRSVCLCILMFTHGRVYRWWSGQDIDLNSRMQRGKTFLHTVVFFH